MNPLGWLSDEERVEFHRRAMERQDRLQREANEKAAEIQGKYYIGLVTNATGGGASEERRPAVVIPWHEPEPNAPGYDPSVVMTASTQEHVCNFCGGFWVNDAHWCTALYGPICADDVRAAKLDRNPWDGQVFDETKIAVLTQVLRSIRDEQSGANSVVKALAGAALEVINAR